MSSDRPRPAVLCILDGWGHRPDRPYNAILNARTPNYERLIATCPQGLIDASETFVGLPKGQMGNSEVGHMNLGAGRVVMQDLPRIDQMVCKFIRDASARSIAFENGSGDIGYRTPVALSDLILRILSKHPADRPGSASELHDLIGANR